MKVDGIELLQMIKDGKIKTDTEIKVWFDDGLKEYITTLYFNGLDLKWQPNTFYARHFYNKYVEFEIIEEEKDIEELGMVYNGNEEDEIMRNRYKINELVREINKLKNK